MRGLFVTFEGGEGSGKSTQIQKLYAWCQEQGIDNVLVTKEPGATAIGSIIRELILNQECKDLYTQAVLFAADRAVHILELIKPALDNGKIVLCDRYIDSTVAYQHWGLGLPRDLIDKLNGISSKGIVPDLTIWLDVPPEIGVQRVAHRSSRLDQFETKNLDFHRRIQAGYTSEAKNHPHRFVRIDATQDLETVFSQVKDAFSEKLYQYYSQLLNGQYTFNLAIADTNGNLSYYDLFPMNATTHDGLYLFNLDIPYDDLVYESISYAVNEGRAIQGTVASTGQRWFINFLNAYSNPTLATLEMALRQKLGLPMSHMHILPEYIYHQALESYANSSSSISEMTDWLASMLTSQTLNNVSPTAIEL